MTGGGAAGSERLQGRTERGKEQSEEGELGQGGKSETASARTLSMLSHWVERMTLGKQGPRIKVALQAQGPSSLLPKNCSPHPSKWP